MALDVRKILSGEIEKLTVEHTFSLTDGDFPFDTQVEGVVFTKPAHVSGEIVKQTRGEKVIIFKKIRRHGYRRKKGHKQDLTVVKITDVKA